MVGVKNKALSDKAAGVRNNFLPKLLRGMVLAFPAALYLSYYPVISFGKSGSMNFELSLALNGKCVLVFKPSEGATYCWNAVGGFLCDYGDRSTS